MLQVIQSLISKGKQPAQEHSNFEAEISSNSQLSGQPSPTLKPIPQLPTHDTSSVFSPSSTYHDYSAYTYLLCRSTDKTWCIGPPQFYFEQAKFLLIIDQLSGPITTEQDLRQVVVDEIESVGSVGSPELGSSLVKALNLGLTGHFVVTVSEFLS
jgi:hypothetical protein